jgi:hypothetical protein
MMDKARDFLQEHPPRDLHDLQLVLAPIEFAGVMLEAAQFPTDNAYNKAAKNKEPVELKPVLILYHQEDSRENICQISYGGTARQRKEIAALLKETCWENDFEWWLGGGEYGCFCGAKRKHDFADVNGLVSRLLGITLHLGRPLRHYGCTFYLPLDLFLDDELKELKNKDKSPFEVEKTEEIERHYVDTKTVILKEDIDKPKGQEKQAYLYFLPNLRDLVFEQEESPANQQIKPIVHWRMRDVSNMSLELRPSKESLPVADAKLTDVSLYHYKLNNMYLLAISVKPAYHLHFNKDSSLYCDNATWWHDLFFADDAEFENIERLQLHHWLHFTNQARIVYASFFEQVKEGKFPFLTLTIAEESKEFDKEDELSPLIPFLLNKFLNVDEDKLKERLKHLADDRMIVSPAYGLAGIAPQTPQERAHIKRLFSLALYVDWERSIWDDLGGYAYDRKFTNELLERDSLERWQELGTYEGFCNYANAYLGFDWFFNDVVAPSHVPYIYGRMLILALFYQMTLRHYNRRINYATSALSEEGKTSEFRKLRQEFIKFTNTYWFHEVTNQIQGIEIFELQTKALGLETEYALIKDEMERADEYSSVLRTDKFNKGAAVIAFAGVIATSLANLDTKVSLLSFENLAFDISLFFTLIAIGVVSWSLFKNR